MTRAFSPSEGSPRPDGRGEALNPENEAFPGLWSDCRLLPTLRVPDPVLLQMLKHAWHALPNECVGMIAAPPGWRGQNPVEVTGIAPCHNHAADPRRTFRVDPYEQFRVEASFHERDWEVVGTYHSHPTKAAEPSGMDTEFMGSRAMLIIHPTTATVGRDGTPRFDGDVCGWFASDGVTQKLHLDVFDPGRA